MRWSKRTVLAGGALALAGVGLGVGTWQATAEDFSSGSVSVPAGPVVDFCPTAEQIALHEQEYGFDYKPSVSCDGDKVSPIKTQPERAGAEPDHLAECKALKKDLLAATPIHDHDPAVLAARLPDGERILIEGFGDAGVISKLTLADYADDLGC